MQAFNEKISLGDRLRQLVRRVWDRFYEHPRRTRKILGLSEAFVHDTDDGFRFRIDPAQYIDRFIYIEGIYERRFLSFIKNLLPRNGVALDIGANIGNHAIYLSRSISEMHCFEPNPEAFRRLTENIELNKISNIRVHQVGIGNEDVFMPFEINLDGNLGASGYVRYSEKRHQKTDIIRLPIVKGDSYIESLKLDAIHFVKIDVEGFEPLVLAGLKSTIARCRPIVAFEFHGQHAARGDFASIRNSLPNYRFFELQFAPEGAASLAKLKWWLRNGESPEISPIDTPETRTYENIIAIPVERDSTPIV